MVEILTAEKRKTVIDANAAISALPPISTAVLGKSFLDASVLYRRAQHRNPELLPAVLKELL